MNLNALPPLIPISNEDLAQQAKMHRSWYEEDEPKGYRDPIRWERECFKNLEFIGDAFLSSEMAVMLDDLYPDMNTGGKEVSLVYLGGVHSEPAWLMISIDFGFAGDPKCLNLECDIRLHLPSLWDHTRSSDVQKSQRQKHAPRTDGHGRRV